MKNIYLVLVCIILSVNAVYGEDIVLVDREWNSSGDWGISVTTYTESGVDYNLISENLTIGSVDGDGDPTSTPTLTFNGNLADSNGTNKKYIIKVHTGATLIVKGDLWLEHANTTLSGNVIVTGNVYLKGTNMEIDANFVIGGTLDGAGSSNQIVGDVYIVNPDNNTGADAYLDKVDSKTLDQLLANEDSDLISDLGEVMEDVIDNLTTDVEWDNGDVDDVLWLSGDNWDSNEVPNSGLKNVIIGNGTTEWSCNLSGDIDVNDLTINAKSTLTISEESSITVLGQLTVNGSLIVENSSGSPSSVITMGGVSDDGTVTIKWNSLETGRWWYMGHSLTNGTVNDNGTYYVYTYDNTNFGWSKQSETYAASPVEGLAVYIGSGTEYSYSGDLNDGDYSFTPQQVAYQVVANPYPSYVDWTSVYNNSTGIDPTYQVYTGTSGARNYATYSATNGTSVNGGSQYIAPGQSFWIEATATTTDGLKFSNGDRVHDNAVSLKSASESSVNDEIRLVLKNSNTNDETVVLFRDYGSSFMTKYDSKKRMVGGNSGNLYTIKNSEYAIINSLPTFQGEEIIPLGYKVSEDGMADFTIQVNDLSNFEPTASVYLEDLDEGVTVNLREEREYTFTPTVAQSDDRFEIRVVPSVATDIDEEPVVSDRNVLIYTVGQLATVKVTEDVLAKDNKKVEVYNVAGQLVKQEVLNDAETSISLPQQNAMYIVKVSAEGYSYQQKVIAQ